MRKLHKVFKLTPQASLLLLTTASLLTAIRIGLLLLPFGLLMQILKILGQSSIQICQKTDALRQIVWAVEVSSRVMPGGVKCLARALTTQLLLNWHSYNSNLKIGVAKSGNGQLEAHAWIDYQGQVLIGNLHDLNRFVPLSLDSFKP